MWRFDARRNARFSLELVSMVVTVLRVIRSKPLSCTARQCFSAVAMSPIISATIARSTMPCSQSGFLARAPSSRRAASW